MVMVLYRVVTKVGVHGAGSSGALRGGRYRIATKVGVHGAGSSGALRGGRYRIATKVGVHGAGTVIVPLVVVVHLGEEDFGRGAGRPVRTQHFEKGVLLLRNIWNAWQQAYHPHLHLNLTLNDLAYSLPLSLCLQRS